MWLLCQWHPLAHLVRTLKSSPSGLPALLPATTTAKSRRSPRNLKALKNPHPSEARPVKPLFAETLTRTLFSSRHIHLLLASICNPFQSWCRRCTTQGRGFCKTLTRLDSLPVVPLLWPNVLKQSVFKTKWGINSSASDHVSCVTVTFSASPHLWAEVLSPIPPAVSYFYIPSYFSMTDLFPIALLCFMPLAFISTCKVHCNPGFKGHWGKGKKKFANLFMWHAVSHIS